jgi:outer membrane protein TolC
MTSFLISGVLAALVTLASNAAFCATTLSLDEYLAKVEKQNLEWKAISSKIDAAKAKSVGVSLSPTMVSLIQMNSENAESARGYEITQSIPFPTKIFDEHAVREFEAQSIEQQSLANQVGILAEAKKAYVDLWGQTEELKILEERKDVLAAHLKLSRSGIRSDSLMKVHFLKAESDLDDLSSETFSVEEKIKSARIKMNLYLNQNPESPLPDLVEPPLEKIPTKLSETNHDLKALEFENRASQKKESLAKSSWFPNFTFRYKEIGATSMAPKNNEWMVGIDLPFLFFWQPRAEAQAAVAERMKAEVELHNKRTSLLAEKAEILAKAQRVRKQLELIDQRLMPRAREREKLIHQISPRDMESLQDHRMALEAGPELKQKRLNLWLEYQDLTAELQKLTTNMEGKIGLSYE